MCWKKNPIRKSKNLRRKTEKEDPNQLQLGMEHQDALALFKPAKEKSRQGLDI